MKPTCPVPGCTLSRRPSEVACHECLALLPSNLRHEVRIRAPQQGAQPGPAFILAAHVSAQVVAVRRGTFSQRTFAHALRALSNKHRISPAHLSVAANFVPGFAFAVADALRDLSNTLAKELFQ